MRRDGLLQREAIASAVYHRPSHPEGFDAALPKADALPTWDNPSAGTSSTTIKFNDYFAYLASAEELANSLDEADEEDKLRALNEAIQNAKAAYDGLASLPNLQQKNVDDIVAALKSRHHRRDGVGGSKSKISTTLIAIVVGHWAWCYLVCSKGQGYFW